MIAFGRIGVVECAAIIAIFATSAVMLFPSR